MLATALLAGCSVAAPAPAPSSPVASSAGAGKPAASPSATGAAAPSAAPDSRASVWQQANQPLLSFVSAAVETGSAGLCSPQGTAALAASHASFAHAAGQLAAHKPPADEERLHRALVPIYLDIEDDMDLVLDGCQAGKEGEALTRLQRLLLRVDQASWLSSALSPACNWDAFQATLDAPFREDLERFVQMILEYQVRCPATQAVRDKLYAGYVNWGQDLMRKGERARAVQAWTLANALNPAGQDAQQLLRQENAAFVAPGEPAAAEPGQPAAVPSQAASAVSGQAAPAAPQPSYELKIGPGGVNVARFQDTGSNGTARVVGKDLEITSPPNGVMVVRPPALDVADFHAEISFVPHSANDVAHLEFRRGAGGRYDVNVSGETSRAALLKVTGAGQSERVESLGGLLLRERPVAGKAFELAVTARGPEIAWYVNGHEAGRATDATFSRGTVAFVVFGGQDGRTVRLRSFRVEGLQP